MFARRVWLRQHKFDISLSRIDYRSLSREIYPLLGIARLPTVTYDGHINFSRHFLSREIICNHTRAYKILIAKIFKARDLYNALHHVPRSALIERAIISPDWTFA